MGQRSVPDFGEIGFGMMGLTFPGFQPRETPLDEEEAFEAMKIAIEEAATFWNAGVFYGTGPNGEALNLEIIAKFFTKYPELADKVFLSVKGGFDHSKFATDGSEEFLRKDMDIIEKTLGGIKKVDLFEMGRVDKNIPIEETVNTLAGFIKEGKFDYIGLSECSAETIRRAHKVHPIAAVEVEFSLSVTDILTNGVLETCNELGIKVIAYSPLGRGILSGAWNKPSDVPTALREHSPRYTDENFEENKKFVEFVRQIAEKKGATPAQVSLKWIIVMGKGNIVPIPGATKPGRVKENTDARRIELSKDEVESINKFVEQTEVKGDRYPAFLKHTLWG